MSSQFYWNNSLYSKGIDCVKQDYLWLAEITTEIMTKREVCNKTTNKLG